MIEVIKVREERLSKPIYWTGKQWAVTAYGVELLDGSYFIQKSRLWEGSPNHDWVDHMAEKEWVDIEDFKQALAIARQKFDKLNKNRIVSTSE